MKKDSKILSDISNSGYSIIIVGAGGIGFNIARYLIEDNFPLERLLVMDGDFTDEETLYKYGYGKNVKTHVPKVDVLRDMARRAYIIASQGKDNDPAMTFDTKYSKNYIPVMFSEDTRLPSSTPTCVINCVDNAKATEMIWNQVVSINEMGGRIEFFDVKFDGNLISVSRDLTWGDYDGYQIASSSYVSNRAAIHALEFIAGTLEGTIGNRSFSMDLHDYKKVVKELNTYNEIQVSEFEFFNILNHYYKDMLKYYKTTRERILKENNRKKRRYFNYLAEGHPVYIADSKTFKNKLYIEGYYVGDKDSKSRRQEVKKFFEDIDTWKFKYKNINVVLPKLMDSSMISLFPPVEVEGLDKDYLRYIYAAAAIEGLDIDDPFLYPYLYHIYNVHFSGILINYDIFFKAMEEKGMNVEKEQYTQVQNFITNEFSLILLLGYMRLTEKDAYLQAVKILEHQKFIKNVPVSTKDIFEYYIANNNASTFYTVHKASSFTLTTETGTFIPHISNIKYDLNGVAYTIPMMYFTLNYRAANSRKLSVLASNIVSVTGGEINLTIPNPSVLDLGQTYYYQNKFASTSVHSLYDIFDIGNLTQYAVSLAYEKGVKNG